MFFLLGQSHRRIFMYSSSTAYAANNKSKKENTIHGYSHGIAGFTEQRTAFTHAQSANLQSQNFDLRVECMLQVPYPRT